jgi:general secretion pathway protein N
MKQKLGLIAIAVIVYCVFLVAKLPAEQILQRVNLPSNINITGVSGTLWSGRARQVNYQGLAIQDVKWQLSALPLLWGAVWLELDAGNDRRADQISIQGEIATKLTNPMVVSSDDFLVYLPTDQVLANVSLPLPVMAGGRFRVTLQELDFDQQCEALNGTGEWLNASVMGTQGSIPLGVFKADLSCTEGAINAIVAEPNMLGLSLNAKVKSMRDITVSGRIKLDPQLPQEVHDASQLFGQPGSDGYTEFRL